MNNINNPKDTGMDLRGSMLVRTAARARECAVALSGAVATQVAPESVSGELANQVLPHLEADLRLSAVIPGPERDWLVAGLRQQRRELGQLVEELDRLLLAAAARPRAGAHRRRAARVLEAAARVLDRHLATERELQACLEAGPDGDQLWALLAGEAEATERLASRSLRFVWHPPVAPTEATALRTNPKASRVVILDAAEASAARAAGLEGLERRIER